MVLKPCSETERDSSNLEEASMEASSVVLKPCSAVTATETMEVSSAVDGSRLRKRKAELDPEEEEEESGGESEEAGIGQREANKINLLEVPEEESGGESEEAWSEDDKTDLLEVPEWDVDSFDGVVYSSSPEPDLPPHYQPYDRTENGGEHYRIYKQQLITSKGFMVDPSLRPYDLYKGIRPVNFDREKTFKKYCEEMVSVCLERHNQDNGLNVELVEVLRGNYRGGPRPKSYITFMAREKHDGPLVEYQAKGMATLDRKKHPILCRPAPTPKPQNQNF